MVQLRGLGLAALAAPGLSVLAILSLARIWAGRPGWPPTNAAWAAALLAAYIGGCLLVWLRYRQRHPKSISTAPTDCELLIGYASQTGVAERLARQTAKQLTDAGLATGIAPLNAITTAQLNTVKQLLLVVSTYGEGEPPDNAALFAGRIMGRSLDLSGVRFGILALGDRKYHRFCGFGRAVQRWLEQQGATPLFDRVEVDAGDAGALRHWQHHLSLLSGVTDYADWSTPGYQTWRLAERHWLNPGSPGGPVYHLSLQPDAATPLSDWQAGDIAEIGPGNAPEAVTALLRELGMDGSVPLDASLQAEYGCRTLAEALVRRHLPEPQQRSALKGLSPDELLAALPLLPHREYSIASLPSSGQLELLVRQMHHPDGQPGLGSGWLTRYAAEGAAIDLRIRSNPAFHPPRQREPLILIGNGTGMAGLRAHLLAREAEGNPRNWLLFGERSSCHDAHFQQQLSRWLDTGHLQRIDLAFSRDQAERVYVQHRLRAAAETLREWLAAGAAIYVCGSLAGMAREVDATLTELLGDTALQALSASGRYRRDVY